MRIALVDGSAVSVLSTWAMSGLPRIGTRHLCDTPARAASGLTTPARWPASRIMVTGASGIRRPPSHAASARQARCGAAMEPRAARGRWTAEQQGTQTHVENTQFGHPARLGG